MPELPEVETVARTLAPQVLGRRISAPRILDPKAIQAGRELLPRLEGARIEAVRRRAKLLLIDAACADNEPLSLAFHLKMTGRLFVHPAGTESHKHTRLTFCLQSEPEDEERLLFFDDVRRFGYCRVMRPEEFAHWSFWAALGPEPLETPPSAIAERLVSRRGRIKALLLNQEVIAGIGNIYADESLYKAGIRPDVQADRLGLPRLTALGNALQEVLRESIRQCGSSIRDYRDAEGNAGAFQNTFMVYGRSGESCRVCGKKLRKCVVAGRTTVFCPGCQKA